MSSNAWPPVPEWVTPVQATPDPENVAGQPPRNEPPLYRDITPRFVKVANPTVGTDLSVRPEGGFIWNVQSITATLVTSAAAANREVALQCFDGTDVLWQTFAPALQVASGTSIYSFIRGATNAYSVATVLRQVAPIPLIPVIGGQTLRFLTTGIDVGDQWAAISVYVYQIEWRKMLGGDARPLDAETWRRQYTSGLLREVD